MTYKLISSVFKTKSGYKTRPKWKINKAVVHARPRNQGQRRRKNN